MSRARSSQQPIDEEENLVWFTASNTTRAPKKERVVITPEIKKEKIRRERPKYYKVEETPLLNALGVRQCNYCDGQVRPQVCGGRKPRWRCGNKACRKWYGWVREGDQIPIYMNQKGRPNGIYGLQRMPLKGRRSRTYTDESLPPTLSPVSPIKIEELDDDEMGDDEEFLLMPDSEYDLTRGLEMDSELVKREEFDNGYDHYDQDEVGSFGHAQIKNE